MQCVFKREDKWKDSIKTRPLFALECREGLWLLQCTTARVYAGAYGLLESRPSLGRESPAWAAGGTWH